MGKIIKRIVTIFGNACFALVSFFVMLALGSLFFVGLGMGLGAGLGGEGLSDVQHSDQLAYSYVSGTRDSANRLLALALRGVILGSTPPNFSPSYWFAENVTYGYELQELFKQAAADDTVKGILLHVQTPGGTIFGSQAIFRSIKAYQETTKRPVLAYIEGLAASGGIMSIVGANAIYADYGSMIGSIGVLGPQLLYFNQPMAIDGGLLGGGIETKGGIEQTMISAGRGKDLGNPFRKITDAEQQNLQAGIDREYAQFVEHVAQNRHIGADVVREQMGAQIFDNQAAQEFGLIDGTLNQEDALAKLAELAQVADDFQFVRPKIENKKFLTEFFGALQHQTPNHTQIGQQIQQDICAQTRHVALAYYGNVAGLCQMP